jgi:hypothetical protein
LAVPVEAQAGLGGEKIILFIRKVILAPAGLGRLFISGMLGSIPTCLLGL